MKLLFVLNFTWILRNKASKRWSMNTTVQSYPIETLLAPVICMVSVAIISIFGNLCIVIATFRKKSLHGICNILIAIESAFDVVSELCTLSYLYYVLSENHYLTITTCWHVQLVPVFCTHVSLMMTLMVGIDRALNIVIPLKVRNIGKVKYLCCMLWLPFGAGIFWAIITYEPMLSVADRLVMCTQLEFAQGNLKYIRSWYLIAVSIVMLVIYALLWLLFKTSKDTSTKTRKILKSLTVITIIIASSYPSSQIITAVSRLCFTPETFIVIAGYSGTLMHVGFAANFFVYLCFSTEYRAAFKELFSLLPCIKKTELKNSQMVKIVYNKN